jgi:hypothetical protein
MEFVLVVEEESCHQAQKLQDIRTGRSREVERKELWVPEIAMSYYAIKSGYKSEEDEEDSSGDNNSPIGKFAKTIKKKNEVKLKKKDGKRGSNARSNEMEEDSDDKNLPIIHVPSTKKKGMKKGNGDGGKKVVAKRVPLANVKVNCHGRAIKVPRKSIGCDTKFRFGFRDYC